MNQIYINYEKNGGQKTFDELKDKLETDVLYLIKN